MAERRRAGADRPRPAHPPPRLPLRAQPVRRVDAQRVLPADAAHLVPRARPRRPARRRRAPSTATCSRRSATATATRAEAVMRRHIEAFEQRHPQQSSDTNPSTGAVDHHERLPARARAVVIGCGIVGNSLVVPPRPARLDRHRADRQGPAAEPGRLDRPRVELHLPRRPQQGDGRCSRSRASASTSSMGVNTECGGIEVARSRGADGGASTGGWRRPRRGASTAAAASRRPRSRSSCRSSTRTILLGGFYTPERVGASTRCAPARSCASEAIDAGALQVFANTEVLDIDVERRRASRRVVTDRGRIEAEYVVIACGVWSPRIARDGRRAHPAHARPCTR